MMDEHKDVGVLSESEFLYNVPGGKKSKPTLTSSSSFTQNVEKSPAPSSGLSLLNSCVGRGHPKMKQKGGKYQKLTKRPDAKSASSKEDAETQR